MVKYDIQNWATLCSMPGGARTSGVLLSLQTSRVEGSSSGFMSSILMPISSTNVDPSEGILNERCGVKYLFIEEGQTA